VKHRRVFRGLLSMGYTSAVVIVVQLATVPVLANSWGLPLYGQWLLLVTVPSFLAAGDFGFGTAAGNRLIGEVARGEVDAARSTFESALALVLGFSAAIVGIVLAVAALLPGRVLAVSGGMDSSVARTVLIVLSLYGIVSIQAVLFIAVMRAYGAFALSATFQATVQLAEGLAVIAVALSGGSPLYAALAYLIVRSVGVAGQVLLAKRRAAWLVLGFAEATRARMSELSRPALAAMLMPLSRSGFLQGSAIAVGAAVGAAAVPVFTSLRTLARVGLFFIYAVNKPILPEFTSEFSRGNVPWVKKITGAIITFNTLVGIVAALVLASFGDVLLAWWTKGAISAPQAMIYLTAAALLAGAVWEPTSLLLLSVNRHEGFTYVFAFGSGLAVALCYVFARHWGVSGAAAASLLFEIFMLGCVLLPLRRLAGPFPLGPSVFRALIPRRWRGGWLQR
jgi:O-antigen/teichoic acid export membrane protein